MQFEQMKALLAHNAERIQLLVEGVSQEQAQWKPDTDSWSILEVVNHLYDEEREDFRVRLDYILHRPGEDPPPIDPSGWVTQRRYNQRSLTQSLADFLVERRDSLVWLDSLENPDWEAGYEAPWGTIRAGDMFAAWVAHDQLHMRQFIELQRAYLLQLAGAYDVRYAGEW